ncbi:MAG: Na/Pi symporter, partial [Acidobacteria bacterium]|nr:Na/Pi symporter [Acidobacteriota bacterium]
MSIATSTALPPVRSNAKLHTLAAVGKALVMLFAFLVGVRAFGDGFHLLGSGTLDSFFRATENPLVGLMVGILATTLVQSSSVTTSMVVGMVAAPENPLPIVNAIPMIMGSNIGTTVTNTLVALAHMGQAKEFRRAFAVATCHDFFNFLTVAVLLPLEIATGFIGILAGRLAGVLTGLGGLKFDSPLKTALKVGSAQLSGLAESLFGSAAAQGTMVVILSGVLIIGSLLILVKTLRSWLGHIAAEMVERALGGRGITAMLIGMAVTVMVQSSSVTTSLLIPFAAAGILTLRQAFPITLGANIGTTVTALAASLAVSGANATAGTTIAIVHL